MQLALALSFGQTKDWSFTLRVISGPLLQARRQEPETRSRTASADEEALAVALDALEDDAAPART